MHDPSVRRIASLLAHSSIFFSGTYVSVGIPFLILVLSADPVVKDNAKEALNFHLACFVIWTIVYLLMWLLIGFLLWPIAWLITSLPPVFALLAVLANSDEPYVYPVSLRLL